MRLIDRQFLETPFDGSRKMAEHLNRSGEAVNRKRVHRLMTLMGLEAVHPKPRTSVAAPGAKAYPYLLRDRVLTRIDEVWSSDITYVPMRRGFMYLTAVIAGFRRCVLSWRLSNTRDGGSSWSHSRRFPSRESEPEQLNSRIRHGYAIQRDVD